MHAFKVGGSRGREELSHLSQQCDFTVIQGFLRKTRLYIYKMLCGCSHAKIILMSSVPSVITLWRSQTKRGVEVQPSLHIWETDLLSEVIINGIPFSFKWRWIVQEVNMRAQNGNILLRALPSIRDWKTSVILSSRWQHLPAEYPPWQQAEGLSHRKGKDICKNPVCDFSSV